MSPPHESRPAAEPTEQRVIRISRIAYLGVLLLLFGVLAPVTAAPLAFGWLLLVPIAALVYITRFRTVVTPAALVTRSWRHERTIRWESVQGIVFPKRGWARANLVDGTAARLPAVGFDRLRDLADASGGRIPNPYRSPDEPDPAQEPE
ncbi:PH domain-containing protein [Skermania piniformis]|uniref:PH domain-containing protein n=1 Tax=Skermania pinensis TaxID=39122 RepID=A0ABX8S4S0_9ACTN|nr:PH domain-containing protein [Skermania piniformis]QXQ12748.1 PH domain-containing protein [Skermania piniformis]